MFSLLRMDGRPGMEPAAPTNFRLLASAILMATSLLIQSCAVEINRFPVDPPQEDPNWMTRAQYQAMFDRMLKEGFYPYEVHGKCEDGYEQFSAKWTGLPWGWKFYARSGTLKEQHDQYNEEYLSMGFSLAFSSTFEDCAGHIRYQGIWLKKP